MSVFDKIIRSSVKRNVLELLSKNARTPSQLADLLNTKLPNITVIIKELSDNYLIHQINPSETRGKVYVLTKKGYSILSEIHTQATIGLLRPVTVPYEQLNSNGIVIDNSSFFLRCLFKKFVDSGDIVSTDFSSDTGTHTTVGIVTEVIKIENNNPEEKEDSNNSSYIAKVEVLGTLLNGVKIFNSSMVPIGNLIDYASSQYLDNLVGVQPQSNPIVIGKSIGRPTIENSVSYPSIGNALMIGSWASEKSILIKDLISELSAKKISICYFTNYYNHKSILKRNPFNNRYN